MASKRYTKVIGLHSFHSYHWYPSLTVVDKQEPPSPSNATSSQVEKQSLDKPVSLKDRIACYQWTCFTMTMATGGVANAIHSLGYTTPWVVGIGIFFFLLNIVLFIMNCVFITIRFHLRPGSFIKSFHDQVETLFVPAFFVSIAVIMINICEYGIRKTHLWLLEIMEVLFWLYVALSVAASAGIYLTLWSTVIFPLHSMTPAWVFPAYPLLLTAPLAGALITAAEATGQPLRMNIPAVALCAIAIQGTGCLIAFMISAAFIYRLMTMKLPKDMQRPGIFMSMGPFGFTAAGIVRLGSQAPLWIPEQFLGIESSHSIAIVRLVSVFVGLWLWGLAMWFFLVSVGSLFKYLRPGTSLPFQMGWWSFVFPNTAVLSATTSMATVFDSDGLRIFASVMTCIIVLVWIGVFMRMIYCVQQKQILYPKPATL